MRHPYSASNTARERPVLAAGTIIAGRYVVGDLLGQGGMGVAYRAWDRRLLTTVAIKQLSITATNQAIPTGRSVELFEREASMLRMLNHPSIPRLLDECHTVSGHFFAMEYIEGVGLSELLARRELSLRARWELAQQICYLVEYLHRQPIPILHRDIETGHFIVRNRRVMMIDFGLAGFVDDDALDDLTIAKSWFSPPEQCIGGALDQRADIYALGQTLREVFGEHGHVGGIAEVLERATSPLSGQRYQSATDLRVSLQASVESLLAREPGWRSPQATGATFDRRPTRSASIMVARCRGKAAWMACLAARPQSELRVVSEWLLWVWMLLVVASVLWLALSQLSAGPLA